MQRAKLLSSSSPDLAFRIKPIAQACGVPLMTVYGWKNAQAQPLPVNVVGSSVYVLETELQAWLKKHRPDLLPTWRSNRIHYTGAKNCMEARYLRAMQHSDVEEMRLAWRKELASQQMRG